MVHLPTKCADSRPSLRSDSKLCNSELRNTGFRSHWLLVLAVAFVCSSATPAVAQLRSGRTSRPLYQDAKSPSAGATSTRKQDSNVRKASTQSATAKPRRKKTAVTQASYVQQADEILGFEPIQQPDPIMQPTDAAPLELYEPLNTYGPNDSYVHGNSYVPGNVCGPRTAYGPLLSLWYRLKIRGEAPLYWRRDQGLPTLVTSAEPGTAIGVAGEIGQATTQTLLSGVQGDEHNTGVRLTFSTWLGAQERFGVMLRYWNAGDQDESYSFDSNSHPILARPFFDTTIAAGFTQNTQLIAFPGEVLGNINVSTTSAVDGLDLTLRRLLYMDRFTRIDWLYGYQRVLIEEGLTISSNATNIGPALGLLGTSLAVTDRFQTENEFNGVSYGVMSTRKFAFFQMESMFRLGAGKLRRQVNISGTTTTTSGGATATNAQGLLARNTNNQPFTDDTFIVIPEVAINLAYQFRPGWHFNVGYNYMMIPKVAQAAQQIDNDLAVNLSDPLVGALDPALDFTERNYWLHSLGLGFQIRY